MPHEQIDTLIGLIAREAELFESFLALLDRQQACLVENDTTDLAVVTELMRERVIESQILNKRRNELLAHIKAANAIESDLTVSRLIEIVDREQAGQLSRLRDTILKLNQRISRTREQNEILLDRSRAYIRTTLEMLARLKEPAVTYAAGGTTPETSGTLLVDRRA